MSKENMVFAFLALVTLSGSILAGLHVLPPEAIREILLAGMAGVLGWLAPSPLGK